MRVDRYVKDGVAYGVPLVECRVCGKRFKTLYGHLFHTHSMNVKAYLELYPGSPLMTEEYQRQRSLDRMKGGSDHRTSNRWILENVKKIRKEDPERLGEVVDRIEKILESLEENEG
jgi:23S rRNA A2030 N6-methylase RlmJ